MGSAGFVPTPYTYQLSQAPATQLSGGTIKIFDPSVFEIATTIVGAIVTVEPGTMRELHVCLSILSAEGLRAYRDNF